MSFHYRLWAALLFLTLPGCGSDPEPAAQAGTPEISNPLETASPQPDPMLLAVQESDIERLDALYEEGRAVDSLDTDGLTLLHHAIVAQFPLSVKWLLDHGANPDGSPGLAQPPLPLAVELAKDVPRETVQNSDAFAIMRLLIESGADPLENRNGHLSAIQRAMDIRCESCITLMRQAYLSRGASLATFSKIQ